MSNELPSEQTTTVTVRVNKDLSEAYAAMCEQQGTSKSEAIRNHMKRKTGNTTDAVEPPAEDMLREGYEAIKSATGANGMIPTDVAKARVAEATRVSKQDAVRCVIRPLDNRGYIIPTGYGTLEVLE